MFLRAEISTGLCMVCSDVIEKNKISCENIVVKKERRGNSYLCLLSLVLLTVEEKALVAAGNECFCGLRYPPARA